MCHNEMGPVPNCDCNGNGKMGLLATSNVVHIATTIAQKNICKRVTLPS